MAATVPAPAPPATVPAGRVLVVDDEPAVANFVARALRRRGLGVDLALSGERALEVALEGRHALLVLDLRMDDVNGTNVVDVYVHRLRDKLGRGLIHTVRSLGYVLEV